MAKKIGVFGGTFDPIHFGHLNLALELSEKRGLDEVWFIPSKVNPFKQDTPPVPLEHRLAMVRLAIAPIPHFHCKDIEMDCEGISYMIDTLRALAAVDEVGLHPHNFFLLLGDDTVDEFANWKEAEEIIRLAPPLIGQRVGRPPSSQSKKIPPAIQVALEQGFTPTRMMDISSTEIRHRLSQRLYCGHLVPASVLHYAEKQDLYTERGSKIGF